MRPTWGKSLESEVIADSFPAGDPFAWPGVGSDTEHHRYIMGQTFTAPAILAPDGSGPGELFNAAFPDVGIYVPANGGIFQFSGGRVVTGRCNPFQLTFWNCAGIQ